MKRYLAAVIAFAAISTAVLAKTGWDDDYEKSLAKAKEENKMVLLDFTGSDWCGWCVKLDKEIFSTDEFKELAAKKLVLVELDYPRSKALPDDVKKQNAELKANFGIRGYPTIILVNSRGKEMKRWVGYNANMLAELKKEAR